MDIMILRRPSEMEVQFHSPPFGTPLRLCGRRIYYKN